MNRRELLLGGIAALALPKPFCAEYDTARVFTTSVTVTERDMLLFIQRVITYSSNSTIPNSMVLTPDQSKVLFEN